MLDSHCSICYCPVMQKGDSKYCCGCNSELGAVPSSKVPVPASHEFLQAPLLQKLHEASEWLQKSTNIEECSAIVSLLASLTALLKALN